MLTCIPLDPLVPIHFTVSKSPWHSLSNMITLLCSLKLETCPERLRTSNGRLAAGPFASVGQARPVHEFLPSSDSMEEEGDSKSWSSLSETWSSGVWDS